MLRIFTVLFVLAFTTPAAADTGSITRDMITAQYKKLESVLNNRKDTVETIKFLHEHISEDARFKLTVTNPGAPGDGKSPVMNMDKKDYINTYIQGTHFVADYKMDIQTLSFKPGQEGNEAYTLDVMTERGLMMSELNKGKPFVSRTTCRTRHEMRDQRLVAAAGECHTDISFEEEI